MNFGSLEKMNPAPDRVKTVEAIRGDFTTPEAQKALQTYSAYLERNAEKETGEGNIKVGLEMAKVYQEAGFIMEALDSLHELATAAQNMQFEDLYNEIWDVIDELQGDDKEEEYA